MKNLFYSLLAIALLVGCAGEKPAEEAPDTTVKIHGTISNPTSGDLTISGPKEFSESATIAEDGSFSMSFELAEPGFYSLRYNNEYASIYLEQGFDLSLSLDPGQFDESLAYEGTGAGYNNYMAGLYLLNEQMDEANPYAARYQRDPASYALLVDSMTTVKISFVDGAGQADSLSANFVEEQKTAFEYERYLALSDYARRAAYYQEVEEVEVPDDYLAMESQLLLENPDMLEHNVYRRYVNVRVNQEAQDRYNASKSEEDKDSWNDVDFANHRLDCIDEMLTAQEIKDRFLHEAMKETVRYNGAKDLTAVAEKFRKLCKDQACIEEIDAELEEWKALWQGQPAPTWEYTDTEGNMVSLASLKGKAVYVDVWASWCGPCKREIPFLKDLEHDMHGQNVAFVSVSIDEDSTAWHDMVIDKELRGYQLLADKAWESSICEDYKINGIPRFILVDTEGNIVTADAPRPSSGQQIRDLIETAMYGDDVAMTE